MNLVTELLSVGIGRYTNERTIRLVRVSNLIYFTIGICCIVVTLVSFTTPIVSYIYLFIAVTSFTMLIANRLGYHSEGKIVFTIILNIGILFSSALTQSTVSHADDRLFFLVNIALASILFDFSEKRKIIPIYVFLLLLIVWFDPLRTYICDHLIDIAYPPNPPVTYYTKFALAGITVALCFFYLKYINSASERQTYQLYQKVEENNHKLRQTLLELSSTQEDLIQSNDELKQFASVISHDLKAPLRAIGTLVDFIQIDQKNRLDKNGKQQFELLKGRIVRLNRLIDGILRYAKIGKEIEKTETIDTHQLIKIVVEMIAPPSNCKIEIKTTLPQIIGEPTRIQQLFQNLLSNAIKFIDKPSGLITIKHEEKDDSWKFSISDNGPGIERKHHEKIFKIFHTLKSRDEMDNTGVGLSIVKKIVEMHHGEIWIDSAMGKGTTFHFTIPKVRKNKEEDVRETMEIL